MTPRDRIHLNALRAVREDTERNRFKAKRRDRECVRFLDVYFGGAFAMEVLTQDDKDVILTSLHLIDARGYREVLAQLHILELNERETHHAKHAEEV